MVEDNGYTESTEQPPEMQLEFIENGSAKIVCCWDFSEITDEEGQTAHRFRRRVIGWRVPIEFVHNGETLSLDYDENDTASMITAWNNVETFISDNATETMNYAKAAKIMRKLKKI